MWEIVLIGLIISAQFFLLGLNYPNFLDYLKNKKWGYFRFSKPSIDFNLTYSICGYFDPRHNIRIELFFFTLSINLPFKSKYTDECDPPSWGIAHHNNSLWIYRGGKGNMNGGNKWWSFNDPWSMQWVRTSALKKDGGWEHETKGNSKDFWQDKWNDILHIENHPYTYKLKSGVVQNVEATIKVYEREWRMHWFKWTKIGNSISRTIDINFSSEVGERSGSWKGGCTGCSYELKNGESPLECLRRMEKERIFD